MSYSHQKGNSLYPINGGVPQYIAYTATTTTNVTVTPASWTTGDITWKHSINPKDGEAPEQWDHYLKIVNMNEDEGQEYYTEELRYEIIHHPNCEKEDEFTSEGEPNPFAKHYTCPVEEQVRHAGLDCLSDEEGNELDWRTLEPGHWPIEAWHADLDYSEYDGGLRLK